MTGRCSTIERVNILKSEGFEERSRELGEEVTHLSPEELPKYLEQHEEDMLNAPKPFADYIRMKQKEKGFLKQDVFLSADIAEKYGYKLLEEESRTKRRDLILRLCLGMKFRPEEVQEALILYGMAPLYGRFRRDAVLLSAFGSRRYDVHEVNQLLSAYDLPPLLP